MSVLLGAWGASCVPPAAADVPGVGATTAGPSASSPTTQAVTPVPTAASADTTQPTFTDAADPDAAFAEYSRFLARTGLGTVLQTTGHTDTPLYEQLHARRTLYLAFTPKTYAKDKVAAFDALVAKLTAPSVSPQSLLLMAWANANHLPASRAGVIVGVQGNDRLIYVDASGTLQIENIGDKSSLVTSHADTLAVDLTGITFPPSAEGLLEVQNALFDQSLSKLKAAMVAVLASRKYPTTSYSLVSDGDRLVFSHYSKGEVVTGHSYWEHVQMWISVRLLTPHSARLSCIADGAYAASAGMKPPSDEVFGGSIEKDYLPDLRGHQQQLLTEIEKAWGHQP